MKQQFLALMVSLLATASQSSAQQKQWEWLHKVPNKYQSMHLVAPNVIAASLQAEGDYQLIDGNGKILHKAIFSSLPHFYDGLMVFTEKDRYGVMDRDFKTVIAPKYEYISDFKNGISFGYNTEPKTEQKIYYHFNLKGELLTDEVGYKLLNYSEQKAISWEGEVCFFVDTNGRKLFGDFNKAKDFSHGRAAVKKGEFWAYIDQNGKEICPFELQEAESFDNGLAIAKKNGKVGLMDTNGRWAVEPQLYSIGSSGQGLFCLNSKDRKQWIVNNKGEKLHTQAHTEWVNLTPNGLLKIEGANGRYQISNPQKTSIVTDLDFHTTDSDGLILVHRGGKSALVDNKAQVVANKWFEGLGLPQFGLIAAQAKGKWGIINQQAQWVVEPTFEELWIVDAQTAQVKQGQSQGFIRIIAR